jgi:ssDNA-binding replication factor A large subunit
MDIEAELLKSISKDELENQIREKIKSFHGFLTREVALRLIAKEKGLLKNEDKFYKLGTIPKGEKRVCFTGKIMRIWPVATYSSGKKSRVVEVEDETGTKPLILWNEDVDLAKTLRLKDEVVVRGAYERNGELHLSYNGSVEITNKAAFSNLEALDEAQDENERFHLRGVISAIEGLDSFVRGTDTIRGFSFMISDGKNERRCVVVEDIARTQKIQAGDEVILEGAKARDGAVELDSHTRILTRRAKDLLLGEIKRIECDGEKLLVEVNGQEVTLDRPSALRFMNLDAETADDISLSTVVGLKKDTLLNSKIAIKIDNRSVVRC